MLRKEVDIEIEIDTYIGNYEEVIAVYNIHGLLDRIYSDFEDRTCNTCTYYRDEDEVCVSSDSPLCTKFVSPTYGCILWSDGSEMQKGK
jgi:hypothetical protein